MRYKIRQFHAFMQNFDFVSLNMKLNSSILIAFTLIMVYESSPFVRRTGNKSHQCSAYNMSYLLLGRSLMLSIMYQINFSNYQKFMNYGKTSKRKNAGPKGGAQLTPKKNK